MTECKGKVHCDTCYGIVPLKNDPLEVFAHGKSLKFRCPHCGTEDVWKGFRQLTRPCFDCGETASGRMWDWTEDGKEIFTCRCPNGHLHYVYRGAFNKTADLYDIKDPDNAKLDSWWADMLSIPSRNPVKKDPKSAIRTALEGSTQGLKEKDLVEICGADGESVSKILLKMSGAGEVFVHYDPHTNEAIYKLVT